MRWIHRNFLCENVFKTFARDVSSLQERPNVLADPLILAGILSSGGSFLIGVWRFLEEFLSLSLSSIGNW